MNFFAIKSLITILIIDNRNKSLLWYRFTLVKKITVGYVLSKYFYFKQIYTYFQLCAISGNSLKRRIGAKQLATLF